MKQIIVIVKPYLADKLIHALADQPIDEIVSRTGRLGDGKIMVLPVLGELGVAQ